MELDLRILATAVAPVIGAVTGFVLQWLSQRQPQLVSHYIHTGAFIIAGTKGKGLDSPPPANGEVQKVDEDDDGKPLKIHTHSIVIKNISRIPATNVVLTHNYLPPNLYIYPNIEYSVDHDGKDGRILIPRLLPKEEVTISYLYYPPVTFRDINLNCRHDAGFAKIPEVTIVPIQPKWKIAGVWLLCAVGGLVIFYALGVIVLRLFDLAFGPIVVR